ncbi:hypothetical protein G6011_11746 [Alternaria panax]|uniref:Uncharacterized protein n=1 Tax=Alternaria panax TaxID=48097 RepID=A0AAD4I5Z6_9PLEO|nr:hypothetical protein G6011_11746 [Alternaria panax]
MAPRNHGTQRETPQAHARGAEDVSRPTNMGINARRPTVADRNILSANTGAGIGARRSTAPTSRTSRSGSDKHPQRCQRTPRVRGTATAAVTRPQNDRATSSRTQGTTRHRTDAAFRGTMAPPTTPGSVPILPPINPAPVSTPAAHPTTILPIRQVNSSPGHASPAFSGRLTRVFPESQRRLDQISPIGRDTSFTVVPRPIRLFDSILSTAAGGGTPSHINLITGQGPLPVPKPRSSTYRDPSSIKHAVSNPNLRAILSDKPYPRERKKSAGERPVLKMGISREYK